MTDTRHSPAQGGPPPPPPTPNAEARGEIAGGAWRLVLMAGSIVALGVFAGVGWLLVVVALVVMIFLHELGHFVTAKWTGMKATEFFIGFGPKLWSFKRGETEYGLKAIPAGAYVRIIGMHNLDEVAPSDESRTYRQKSFPRRLLVASAGSGMHFLQAFVLLFVVFAVVGAPGSSNFAERLGGPGLDPQSWFVGQVSPDSGADDAGIQGGDRILSIAGQPIDTFEDVGRQVQVRPQQTVPIIIERDGEQLQLEATLGLRRETPSAGPGGEPDSGFLGVGPDYPELPTVTAGPVESASLAARETAGSIGMSIEGIGSFFTGGLGDFADQVFNAGEPSEPATGGGGGGGSSGAEGNENRPISIYGVARIMEDLSADGFAQFFLILALINVFIGVFNLIPLLPLDGGHVAVAVYERIRSRRGRRYMADVAKVMPLAYATVIFLVLLGVSSLYLDIVSPLDIG